MFKVIGKVLVKETGVGVPNLLVVLYDVDPRAVSQSTAYMDTSCLPGAGLERIGSVLTTENGDFELSFDASSFVARDPESRPDLILAVYAPEDSQGFNQPTPLPPSRRLLLFSNVQRQNAGQSEAYILRVPRTLLEKFDIPIPDGPGGPDPKVLASRLIKAQESHEELKALVREGLAPLRKARLQRHREIVTASKTFVKRLGAAPLAIRMQPTFVGPGNDLKSAQRVAMGRGLVALKGRAQNRPFVYAVTPADFAVAGMIREEAAQVYELTHEQMCRLIGHRLGGVALERVMDLVDAQKKETEAKRRVDRITTTTHEEGQPVETGTGGGQPPVSLTGTEAITAGVLGQLTDLTAPSAAPAASIEELSARLTGFTLPPGPADVTSFHDFHQLQIAFEHVWTEAFDENLRDRVRDLYTETAKLHEDLIDPWPFESLTELSEMYEVEEFISESSGQLESMYEDPPEGLADLVPEAVAVWPLLSDAQRKAIDSLALYIASLYTREGRDITASLEYARKRIQAILAQASGRAGRLTRLLSETRQRLSEPYAFHYFAPNSVNFGILVTYRQKWEPLNYQVGDLVSTIPLAPGEVRRFSSKTVIKRTRAQKELEKALSSRSGESSLTQRAEAEITDKASTTTNFRQTAQGSFRIGIGNLDASTEFVLNQAQESASIKKSFREAVIKAAQEYKQERALEIETTQETTVETTTSGEISNPNNEMTVTYLLYELERQYRISERIHRVMPVILVAQDVPAPHEITESWLLAHDWILRRVLLDDSLQPALDQLSESFAGEELSVAVKKGNWETQERIVEKLEATVSSLISKRDALRQSLLGAQYSTALARAVDDAGGFLTDLAEGLTADLTGAAVDVLKAGVNKIKGDLEFVQESLGEAQQNLASAQEALASATKEYTEAIEAQTNRRVAIDQLRVHVKDNILYYMQAIWDHEPPDQRFFRLYYQEVDLPEAATNICRLRKATQEELALGVETIVRHGDYYVIEGCEAPDFPDPDQPNTKKLVEIADLDHPLGYKGNYIIFPLKTCVYLTEFMMKQFIDGYFGVRDPDEAANYSTEELLTYLESIWNDPKITLSDKEREAILNIVLSRIREPRRESDIVVVPSGQIYIEALLGGHPLLEPFKRIHRAYDVGKARAELRKAELDNLRRAARMLQDEPDLDDPDIDKRVRVEGVPSVVVNPE